MRRRLRSASRRSRGSASPRSLSSACIHASIAQSGGTFSSSLHWRAMPSETATAPTETRAEQAIDRALLSVAVVVVLGVLMSILDTTVVNVAISHLSTTFDTSLTTIQWIVTGYTLPPATVIPITGWAADRFGTKRLYMLALALVLCGSILSGLAWSAGSLIAFRVLEGLGGGMLMPAGMTIRPRPRHAARHADPPPRGRASAGRIRDEHHRRADAPRPDRRPYPRRLARRR